MKEITKAQEEILKALWEIKEGAVSDVLEALPEPRPAYNTVATVIKVLEKKGYATHKTFGKTNVYFPAVTRKEYGHHIMTDTFRGLFDSSVNQMLSTFVKGKNISIRELEELREMLESEIRDQKK
jgi:BlaI family transcriptional regulator, penicillinase repressor